MLPKYNMHGFISECRAFNLYNFRAQKNKKRNYYFHYSSDLNIFPDFVKL